MITVNTVLILGAGASHDFGYPLGEELKNKVISVLSNSEFQADLENGYGTRPAIKYLINGFIADLKKDRALTIDRFLAKSNDEYKTFGKVAIAKAIVSCEKDDKLFQDANCWYNVLYSLMDEHHDLEKFSTNKLSVITFNYDRSFEHYFFERLSGAYGPQRQNDIIRVLREIPVVHLHGRVNMLPWEDSSKSCSYGEQEFVPHIFDIAAKMKLPDEETDALVKARSLIDKAQVIYFLGFGYDQFNLSQLNINLIEKCNQVFGTCYNLPVAIQQSVNSIFNKKINFYKLKVNEFLMDEFNPNDHGLKKSIQGLKI